MRVLFVGDVAATGFGTVTRNVVRRMLDAGEDVRLVSLNAEDIPLPEFLASITLSVLSLEAAGEDEHFLSKLMRGEVAYPLWDGTPWGEWVPDAAILLGDYEAVRTIVGMDIAAFRQLPTFHYCPIEGVDLPPLWNELWSVIRPIAMSKFGAVEIAKVTGSEPPMIYHGVNTEEFYPVSRERPIVLSSPGKKDAVLTSKRACRAAFLPSMIDPDHPMFKEVWMLRTDRHMPRKRYASMIRAVAPVLRRNPNVRMVIHCAMKDQGGYMWDDISKVPDVKGQFMPTEAMKWLWPQTPDGRVIHQPFSVQILNALYNACDVYVSTSAEGFGLTIAEAIACGLPAVGLDYSAVPEVIGPAGVLVPVAYLFDNEYSHSWAVPDEQELTRRIEFLVTHRNRREDLGRKGPAHVAAHFSWDQTAKEFAELLHASVVTRQAA